MRKDIEMLIEYENILIGKSSSYPTLYMKKSDPEIDAITIIRYAFLEVLGWTADMIRDYATPALIDALKIGRPVSQLNWPPEFDHTQDMFFIAWKVDPKAVHYTDNDFILNTYARVLTVARKKYPKNFFGGVQGEYNAKLCMQYIVNQKLSFDSVYALYEYFADDKRGMKFLKNNYLESPAKQIFGSPLKMLHESLPDSQKNTFLYVYYDFMKSYRSDQGKKKK